jgi:hypothetical protein
MVPGSSFARAPKRPRIGLGGASPGGSAAGARERRPPRRQGPTVAVTGWPSELRAKLALTTGLGFPLPQFGALSAVTWNVTFEKLRTTGSPLVANFVFTFAEL